MFHDEVALKESQHGHGVHDVNKASRAVKKHAGMLLFQ